VGHYRLKTERGHLNKPQNQSGFFPFRHHANAV
jgi:hypothetical protein